MRPGQAKEPLTSTFHLTLLERQLVDAMSRIQYGRIEGLKIERGRPSLAPRPRIIRGIRFGAGSSPEVKVVSPDYELKGAVVELIRHIRSIELGQIPVLHVRDGLPAGMELELTEGLLAMEPADV